MRQIEIVTNAHLLLGSFHCNLQGSLGPKHRPLTSFVLLVSLWTCLGTAMGFQAWVSSVFGADFDLERLRVMPPGVGSRWKTT